MSRTYQSVEVFVPNDVPIVTYIDRQESHLEKSLRDALTTPGQIVSLSGPSKSGKTVLIKKVIPFDELILISGASIQNSDSLWARVLSWMDLPSEIIKTVNNTFGGELGGKASGKVGLPLVVSGEAEASSKLSGSRGLSVASRFSKSPIDAVVHEIGGSSFTIFIDDFHYMKRETQIEVARQIKEISEKGVKICTASVPYRSDDVVRGNPELRGRVAAIDFNYWSEHEISQIAERGFEAMGISISKSTIEDFSKQAFGSPQLMQAMCLQLCHKFDINHTKDPIMKLNITKEDHHSILRNTSTTSDFTSLVRGLQAGAKVRGTERKLFDFVDGSKGDVYRCVLLSLVQDPPLLSLPYDAMYDRTRAVCMEDVPTGSSVTAALAQMQEIAKTLEPQDVIIEWDENNFNIANPYFLFFLRCSAVLDRIKAQ